MEVPWENPNPVEFNHLDGLLETSEAQLGPLDRVGRFLGRGASKNLALQMLTGRSPSMLRNGDLVFVDHRRSGCLTEVRDQGRCGPCCVFSLVSVFEWMYCMKTGNRIDFSEQYLLDCGWPFDLRGCNGGTFEGVVNFVNNVGLELLADYPYKAREESCPYDEVSPSFFGMSKLGKWSNFSALTVIAYSPCCFRSNEVS